jgi:predicted ArsR family transcriptional regulator
MKIHPTTKVCWLSFQRNRKMNKEKKAQVTEIIKTVFSKHQKINVKQVSALLGKEKIYITPEAVRPHLKTLVSEGFLYEEYEKASRANNIKIIYCLK